MTDQPAEPAASVVSAREARPPRPTFAQFTSVARRPKWIAGLFAALAVAAAFAALGQWQFERSFDNVVVEVPETETYVPLETVAEPQQVMRDPAIGQKSTVSGSFLAGEFTVLTGRDNDGTLGSWLVGHLVTAEGASLAVGVGWAPDAETAEAAESRVDTDAVLDLRGRYLPAESLEMNDVEAGERRALSPAELVNLWAEPGPTYAGYLVLEEPLGGLELINQPPPMVNAGVNWLNVFYALEWLIFGVFAAYLWYRVVRDVWEAEQEALQAAGAGASVQPGSVD